MRSSPTPRRVAIVVYPGVQSLDVFGPLEVFAGAQRVVRAAARRSAAGSAADGRTGPDPVAPGSATRDYAVQLVSVDGAPLRTSSGVQLTPDARVSEVAMPLDTLLVPGGDGCRWAEADDELLGWIAQASRRARRTASVCTGAFVLAAAGLLDGRRVTTHWSAAAELRARYPAVHVDANPIYIRDCTPSAAEPRGGERRDGELWTSAGVTAGMDLALALVEDDVDRDTALLIARHLVLFLRRPGNQAQFSATLGAQQPSRPALRELQSAIVEDLAGDHTVAALAARAHMSPRHFARAFRAETGVTPGRFVERVRLEAARMRLEDGGEDVGAIASRCGFGTPETMRRAFLRALHVSPAEYRRRFRAASGASATP